MGLSTKQVSGDHEADWVQSGSLELPKPPTVARRQQPQQPPELVPCPRCSSTNTKFCYYNNYNKSQPRHYCKACKRHWTKGGTLRNVPVGGGRKNKRLKTSAASSGTTAKPVERNTQMGNQGEELSQAFYQTDGVQKDVSEDLYEIRPPGVCLNDSEKSVSGNESDFLASFLENQTQPFTFSSLNFFENNPCFRSLDVFNFTAEGLGSSSMDDTTITSTIGSDQTWQVPTTMEPPSFWNWEDIDPLLISNELSSPDWGDDKTKVKTQS